MGPGFQGETVYLCINVRRLQADTFYLGLFPHPGLSVAPFLAATV